MADKQLTEAAWKAVAKGKTFKDAALLKAFGALDKAEKSGPPAWLAALDEVDKQADLLRKANKADKELGGHLDGIDKAVAKERKAAEAARDKAAADDGEEEDSPALLTTKMVPLLRQVARGDVVMQVLIATTGKETALLLSKRSIAPARGRLLKEYLGVAGGVKLITGECLFENKAHTFAVTTQAAGLAKKLKAALLAQTELRLKVRVRGLDGAVEEEGGADDEGDGDAAASTADAGSRADAGAAASGGAAADGAAAANGGGHAAALAAWRSARERAVATLKAAAKDIAALRDPESAAAIVQISAVMKNLTAEPASAQQVAELWRYIDQDDVVLDVSDIVDDIRTPLLAALGGLRDAGEAAH